MRVSLVSLVVALVLAGDALACTCLPVELERDLPQAGGAVIGTVLERRSAGSDRLYLLRVEQVYKGDINDRVEVITPANGAACGLELAIGQRVGLLLDRQGDRWRSGLCSQVDPADFLALTNVDDNTLPAINWGGYLVGLLVLGGGAFFLVRRLRR